MSITLESIEAEVLNLPAADRSRLLDKLIASLDADQAIEEAWRVAARRRDEEIESGAAQAIAGNAVLARLRAALR
jgi:hypothetical protein